MQTIRNRQLRQTTPYVAIGIDELRSVKLPIDIHWAIAHFLNAQTLIAFSKSSWGLYCAVLLQASQLRLMDMYHDQMSALGQNRLFLTKLLVHHDQASNFIRLARNGIPRLINKVKQKDDSVSVFKLLGFIESVEETVKTVSCYYKIDRQQYSAEANYRRAHRIFAKALAIAAFGGALVYLLDSMPLLFLTALATMTSLINGAWRALASEDNHWKDEDMLAKKIMKDFNSFASANLSYSPLARRVLLTFRSQDNQPLTNTAAHEIIARPHG